MLSKHGKGFKEKANASVFIGAGKPSVRI